MGRTLAEILWQLERKRKYCLCWSGGTNRATTICATIAKAMTLVLVLSLVYFTICSMLLGSSSELDTADDQVPTPLVRSEYHYRSTINGHYIDHFPNISIPDNILSRNTLDDVHDAESSNIKVSHVNKLTLIFHKADRNQDGYLDGLELTRWINERVKAHLTFALQDNFEKYFQIDTTPRNGLVTWEEYLTYFFKTQGVEGITAKDIRNRTPAFNSLPRNVKVEIARVQAKWSEAVTNNPDFLTVDEFLAFEHPEASPTQILYQVQDVFLTFDHDADGVISKTEFETTYREAEGVDKVYKNDKHLIDTDGNGQISRVELMRYMDPRNLHHVAKDAIALLKLADLDKDGRLKLSEILNKRDLIVVSKFYDVERSLHNVE